MTIAKPEILLPLQESRLKGTLVTIRLRHHAGDLVTTVRQITDDIIYVRPLDIPGLGITRSSFYLAEIDAVKALKIFNSGTLYVHLKQVKEKLVGLKEKFGLVLRQRMATN